MIMWPSYGAQGICQRLQLGVRIPSKPVFNCKNEKKIDCELNSAKIGPQFKKISLLPIVNYDAVIVLSL